MGTFVNMPDIISVGSGYLESKDFVGDRISQVTDYADQSFTITQEYINSLNNMLSELAPPDTSQINVDRPETPDLDYSARPKLGDVEISDDWPDFDTSPPSFTPMPALTGITLPSLSVSSPVSTAAAPTLDDVTPPGDAPILDEVAMPTAPSLSLPAAPVFDDIILPAPPVVALPPFEAELPSITLDDPAVFAWGEPAYNSDIWSDLLAKVLNDIRNGGTGLNVAVEAELYQRFLDRTTEENVRMYDEANNYFAARGFTLPPGALAGRLNEINQQISRNNILASREITINQAELAQKNTQFIVEMGGKLEGMIREFYAQGVNRTLDAAKFAAQNAIDLFNAQVTRHNLSIAVYNAQIQAYEGRIKGLLTEVEVFKTQVEAAKVSGDLQKTLADMYDSQVRAALAQAQLYNSEIEGAKISMDLQAARMENYRTQTQAYVARMDGEKIKLALYDLRLKADATKAQIYAEQVRAYGVEVGAAISQQELQIKQMQAALEQNKNEVEIYRANLAGYEAEVRAKAALVTAQVDGFRAEAGAYSAETQADASKYQAQIEEIRANIEAARLNMQQAVAQVDATIKGYSAVKELQTKGTQGIMDVGAQLTASAMSAVHASTSFGFSGHGSNSESWSHGESISESHSYKES